MLTDQTDQNSVKVGGKRKQKSVPLNTTDHTIEILQKELSAAQSRIVILDSEIKDKNEQLKVLWARIKILEEKQNKDIIDKYFPKPNKGIAGQDADPSEQPTFAADTERSHTSHSCSKTFNMGKSSCPHSVSPPACCLCSPPQPWSHKLHQTCFSGLLFPNFCPNQLPVHHHCNGVAQSDAAPPSRVLTNHEEIQKLRTEVNMLMKNSIPNTLPRTSSNISGTSSTATTTISSMNSNSPPLSSTISSIDLGQDSLRPSDKDNAAPIHPNNLNASVASVEEIMEVIGNSPPATPTPHLNFQVPTSQQELMLL